MKIITHYSAPLPFRQNVLSCLLPLRQVVVVSRVSASYPCCDRWKVLVRLLPLTWQMVRSRLPPTPA